MDGRLEASERRRRDKAGGVRALRAFRERVDRLDIGKSSRDIVARALDEEIDKLED